MADITVRIGDWINAGFELYKKNFALLVVASLLAFLLSIVTFGILSGPMFAGLALIALALVDGKAEKLAPAAVFDGFAYFLDAFLLWLLWAVIVVAASWVLGMIPCAGGILSVLVPLLLNAFLLFAIFLIVDKKLAFWPAALESIEIVKRDPWPLIGFSVLVGLIAAVGGIACGIGVVITGPIALCAIAIAYRDIGAQLEAKAAAPVAESALDALDAPLPPSDSADTDTGGQPTA